MSETTTTQTASEPKQEKKLGGLAQAVLLGGGFAGGTSIIFGVIQLIRSEPDKSFKLLHDWGPWCFLAIFVAYVVWRIASRGLDVAESFGTRIADAMDRVAVQQQSQAEAMQAQAVALEKSADKDDRNLQEVQTLTSLTAQRAEKTFAMLQAFHQDNRLILEQQQKTLDRIEAKVDGRIQSTEKS